MSHLWSRHLGFAKHRLNKAVVVLTLLLLVVEGVRGPRSGGDLVFFSSDSHGLKYECVWHRELLGAFSPMSSFPGPTPGCGGGKQIGLEVD